jgi:hypothetical protein
MVVGEHGVEEKVVVSREEVVAMAIAAASCVMYLLISLAVHP